MKQITLIKHDKTQKRNSERKKKNLTIINRYTANS